MPKPNINTPIDDILRILVGGGVWYDEYKMELMDELGASFDGKAESQQMENKLRAAEESWVQERKEDKDNTTERQELAVAFQLFDRGIRASVKRRARGLSDPQRVISDFDKTNISRIRSIKDINQRIIQLRTSINVHRDLLKQGKDRTQYWLDTLDDFETKAAKNGEDHLREKKETAESRTKRDQMKSQAIDFIEDMELAAESIMSYAPEAYAALQVLFDTVIPSTPVTKKTNAVPSNGEQPVEATA